jgi:hypothetical protein
MTMSNATNPLALVPIIIADIYELAGRFPTMAKRSRKPSARPRRAGK